MDAQGLTSPQRKLVMWYKVKELKSKGLKHAQIGRELGLHRDTVRKYSTMTLEEFQASEVYQRNFLHKLDPYEDFVKSSLGKHPYLSASQIHDWLRERYDHLPFVNSKTVFNYVKHIRSKYKIPKATQENIRQGEKQPEPPMGEYAQADFGEYWMLRDDSRRVKVYFFIMLLSRSRRKYFYFSRTPFTAALAVYAHQKAFAYYGGKPGKILYDQDKILLNKENLGDVILTKAFQAFVSSEHFECVFCHKADPQSKGRVENAVKYVKMSFLRGREFTTIENLQIEGLQWLDRTANGLPHSTTRLVPDEIFQEEQKYLEPYYGTPVHPQEGMKEYLVRNDNTINFHSHFYSVPTGTFHGSGTFVWVNVKEGHIEIYSNDTGKQICWHPISVIPGQAVLQESHHLPKIPCRKELENYILSYLEGNTVVAMWLENLYRDKPRYYRSNISRLNREIESFYPETMIRAFEICLDRGLYNANDLINLCERMSGRIPKEFHASSIAELLPESLLHGPEKTNINDYTFLFS
jgi:transposase